MATIIIVPATEGAIEDQVHLEYTGDVSMDIKEMPELGLTLVTVVDEDGEEQVFENPASYSFSEDE